MTLVTYPLDNTDYSMEDAALDRLDGKVTALEGKPGKRWDNLVEKLIWAVVAAVAGFFLAQIGLG